MVKLLITNMRFIAYLFRDVHVLDWKMLNLTLEFEKPTILRKIVSGLTASAIIGTPEKR